VLEEDPLRGQSGFMMYQLQYQFKGVRPTKTQLQMARRAFALGKAWPGVKVKPIAWTGTLKDLRKALLEHKAFIGEAGIVKTYAKTNQTFCDFDGWRPSLSRVWRIAAMLRITPRWIREDKTKRGWHLVIEWSRQFTRVELVALQCLLGSDLQRETYNLARVMSGKKSERWNLLFERKL
jgi:hypothetical protein